MSSTFQSAGASILRNSPTPNYPRDDVSGVKNVSYDLRVNTTFIPKTPNYQSETPRAKWRRQFWQKTTPWAEDRRAYGGLNFYNTTLKPSSRNHVDIAGQWSFQDKSRSVTAESVDIDDIIALLVKKIEQHNSSAFELSRTFKFFDKNHSQTIDAEELESVLKSFALELSSFQIDAILDRFEAKDRGDGQGRVISYPDFINAFVKIKEQHPFLADRKKMMEDGRRRDSAKVRAAYGVGSLSGMDQDGRRLVTPGNIAPVGCPTGGLSPSRRSRPEPLGIASPSPSRRTGGGPSPSTQSHRYLPT